MSDQVAIRVNKVYKNFRLPHQQKNSLKSVFTGIFDIRKDKNTEVQHALKDISFEIKQGEFFGIVGRNGSGKSTLLKILAGIYQPTKGTVGVKGKLVPFIELGVGFNPELTGRENVFLNGALLGFDHNKIGKMYDDIVEFAELERFMDQKLKNYSSGMQVRLAFSMAIRADAGILLIDEVLAVGDADFQRKCFAYFKELKSKGKTVVFVTHDMNAVREYCDRAIIIDKSELKVEGSAEKIAQEYTKLFNQPEAQSVKRNKEPGKNRWGDEVVQIKSLDARINQDKGRIELTLQAEVRAEIDNPSFGFLVKSAAGKSIMGTNMKIMRHKLGKLTKGQVLELEWYIENILASGHYAIDVAVTHSDDITVCDYWEDATKIEVQRETATPYDVVPRIEVQSSVLDT